MPPRVSIVIPTWNGRDLLADCLRSVERQTLQPFEVLVVDDGSTDDTLEMLARDFPRVWVHRMPENLGFCAACNAGLRLAAGEFVLLLNNDVTLARDCLARLVATAERTAADMVGPLILWRDEPATIYAAGDRQLGNGRAECIGFRQPLDGFAFPERVFGVSAAVALYRKSLLETTGLFDERFRTYFSDSDLSFRARLAGFEAAVAPAAIAYHVGSASLGGVTWRRTRECHRNHALLVVKNMPTSLILRHAPGILAEHCRGAARLIAAARCEFGLLRALGMLATTWCSLLGAFPHALRERKRIQGNRRLTVKEVDALLGA